MKCSGKMVFSLLALLALAGIPSTTGIGFQDDTFEPCLGFDDPYCDGSGPPQSTCWECYWHWSSVVDPVACRKNLDGRATCSITYTSYLQGGQSVHLVVCDESGGRC